MEEGVREREGGDVNNGGKLWRGSGVGVEEGREGG